jgi:hypothetical protein
LLISLKEMGDPLIGRMTAILALFINHSNQRNQRLNALNPSAQP